jgi:hypothetical protein
MYLFLIENLSHRKAELNEVGFRAAKLIRTLQKKREVSLKKVNS